MSSDSILVLTILVGAVAFLISEMYLVDCVALLVLAGVCG